MSEDVYKELYENIENCVPKYCPECGKEFVRISDGKIWVMPYGDPKGKEKFVVTGFDCYCDNCEWSGNVEPDSLMDIEYMEKQEVSIESPPLSNIELKDIELAEEERAKGKSPVFDSVEELIEAIEVESEELVK